MTYTIVEEASEAIVEFVEDLDEAIINGLNGNTTLYIAKISPN